MTATTADAAEPEAATSDAAEAGSPIADRFPVWLTLGFAALSLAGVLHHEMWRDEVHTWLLALHCATLNDLRLAVQVDGHGPAWYLITWVAARLVAAPETMQIIHWLFAVAGVAWVVRYAPFSRLQRLLFCGGYFVIFEYCLLARNYVVTFYLIIAAAALLVRRGRSFWLSAALLCVLGQWNIYAWLYAVGLAPLLLWRCRDELRRAPRLGPILTAVAWIGLMAVSLTIHLPDQVAYYSPPTYTGFHPDRLAYILRLIGQMLVPIPVPSLNFWGSSILPDPVLLALGGLSLPVAALLLRRQPLALLYLACGVGGFVAIEYAKHLGALRHVGLVYAFVVGAAWIVLARPETSDASRRLVGRLFTTLLALHVAAGGYALVQDIRLPFSGGKQAAQIIAAANHQDSPWVADFPYLTDPIMLYGQHAIYLPRKQSLSYWSVYDQTMLPLTVDELVQACRERMAESGGDAVLIMSSGRANELVERNYEGLYIFPIGQTKAAIQQDEFFLIYVVSRM